MKQCLLLKEFRRLSQHSVDSVQNGTCLSSLDKYLHIDRPIENKLGTKMSQIESNNGGIIFLVGSAGDGKSHLISQMKEKFTWSDNCFYNDATASCSPTKTAVDTLKESLIEFDDNNLETTTKKLVLAINLGKLNAFIEDDEVKVRYSKLVKCIEPIFNDDDSTLPKETSNVKIILFTDEQIFEFHKESHDLYPVNSRFLSGILDKITDSNDTNPFYKAYRQDIDNGIERTNPIILNYELLRIPSIRETIVLSTIETIIRFGLKITPREFLDFIYSIVVYHDIEHYTETTDFFKALTPTLLYNGGDNLILKSFKRLDPLRHSSSIHDNELALLFSSDSIPKNFLDFEDADTFQIPDSLIDRTNKFYQNNNLDIEDTSKFVFRLKHVLNYQSENTIYKEFLHLLSGIYRKEANTMTKIYSMVETCVARHFGSYSSPKDMVPLQVQGSKYKLFAELQLVKQLVTPVFYDENNFKIYFKLNWLTKLKRQNICLIIDYQLFRYLAKLNDGKLALSYENEKNLSFSRFVRTLAELSDKSSITVLDPANSSTIISQSFANNIQIS